MSYMFSSCGNLTSLDLGDKFDTSQVTDMQYMFYNCSSLTSLDLGDKFDTSQVTNMRNMFYSCSALQRVELCEKFSFKGRVTTSSYRALLPTPPANDSYTGYWVRVGDEGEPRTAAWLRDNFNGTTMAGTWVWQRQPTDYTLVFDGNGAQAGAMASVQTAAAEDATLPANRFAKYGCEFAGWELWQINGVAYRAVVDFADGATIPAGRFAIGDVVTLRAVWEERGGTLTGSEGEFSFQLRGGEMATLTGIPAGTAYEVWEETEDGWVLVEKSGDTGEIESLQRARAAFVNRYDPLVTSAQIEGVKLLDGSPAEAGAFRFTLEDEAGTVLQTVENGALGAIRFDPLSYGGEGTFTYRVREIVESADETVDYDTHVETVYVVVRADADGALHAEVQYDESGLRFENGRRSGSLTIRKSAEGALSDSARETIFRFRVSLPELAEGTRVTWLVAGGALQTATVQNGAVLVSCKAGESVEVTGLPHGTAYSVEEIELPAGWTLVSGGGSGTISAVTENEMSFVNRYAPEETGVTLTARKRLSGAALEEGQFSFALFAIKENGETRLQVQGNGAAETSPVIFDENYDEVANPWFETAQVVFDELRFGPDDLGEHVFEIRELVNAADGTIVYDEHAERVTVTVTDEGGSLSASVSYENGEAVFENAMAPGKLRIEKETENGQMLPNAAFLFTVTLSDAEEQALSGSFTAVIYDAAGEEKKRLSVGSGESVTLLGGEACEIEGLPHGTRYSVSESELDEWQQISQSGSAGTVQAAQTSTAHFVNRCEPRTANGSVTLTVTKRLEGRAIREDDGFSFELLDEQGNLLQTVGCVSFGEATSSVRFAPLSYGMEDAGREFVYYIREQQGDDENVIYDARTITATVRVTDAGGNELETETVYSVFADGEEQETVTPGFTNTVRSTSVSVEKRWDDADNAQGLRPESVTVQLLANGRVI